MELGSRLPKGEDLRPFPPSIEAVISNRVSNSNVLIGGGSETVMAD